MNEIYADARTLYGDVCKKIPHAVVMERMRTDIRAALSGQGVSLNTDTTILFDDTHGSVIVINDSKIIEGEIASLANATAGNTLRALAQEAATASAVVSSAQAPDTQTDKIKKTEKLNSRIFWGLNTVILTYWCIWFVNFVLSAGFREWYDAAGASSDFGILGLLLFLLLPTVPVVAVISALLSRNGYFASYTHASALMHFEIPALFATFLVNALMPILPLTFALRICVIVCLLSLLVHKYIRAHHIGLVTRKAALSQLLVGSVSMMSLVYLTLLFVPTFYLVALEEVGMDIFDQNWGYLLQEPLSAILMLVGILAFFAPLGVWWVWLRYVKKLHLNDYERFAAYSRREARAVRVAMPVIFITTLFLASTQFSSLNYTQNLLLLAQDNGGYISQSARARELVTHKDAVDQAIRSQLYTEQQYLLKKSDLTNAHRNSVAGTYLLFTAFPFWYDNTDPARVTRYGTQFNVLAKGYERAFGEPIDSVNTMSKEPITQVHLSARDIHALTNSSQLYSTVTVTDSLYTLLPADQEVVYEFSLPDDAVITDLRLGPSLEHKGQIAPRGAAQQTYVNQVQRRVDPALLEQTGPRQYRLRVFPVPGVSERAAQTRREAVEGATQRVQFTYTVVRDPDGIALPVFSEEYNLNTEGVRITATIDGMPAQLDAHNTHVVSIKDKATLCAMRGNHVIALPNGSEARFILSGDSGIGAPYMSSCRDTGVLFATLKHKKILFLADTSYANRDGSLSDVLRQMESLPASFYAENAVHYAQFGEVLGPTMELKSPQDIPRADDIVYFGKSATANALATVPAGYDAVIVLARKDQFKGEQITTPAPNHLLGTSVIFVHSDNTIPAYPAEFETIVARAQYSGVVTDIMSALTKISSVRSSGTTLPYLGPYWYVEETVANGAQGVLGARLTDTRFPIVDADGLLLPTNTQASVTPSVSNSILPLTQVVMSADQIAFANMMERSLIVHVSKFYKNQHLPPPALTIVFDAWFARAKEKGIVTPISSYIALVNETQQNLLNTLSNQTNKYTSEQRFSVTQPGFVGVMSTRGMMDGFGGGSSLGLQGTISAPAAPTVNIVPSGSMENPAQWNPKSESNYMAPPITQPVETGSNQGMTVVRISLLLVTFGILGGAAFATYRILKRAKHQ